MEPDRYMSLAATVDAPVGWRSRIPVRHLLRWESGLAVVVPAIGVLVVRPRRSSLPAPICSTWACRRAR